MAQIQIPNLSPKSQSQNSKSQSNTKSQFFHKYINMSVSLSMLLASMSLVFVWLSLSQQFQSQQESLNGCGIQSVPACTHQTAWYTEQSLNTGWCGRMSNNQQWFGCRISWPKSNRKKYQIESNPNRRLPNRIFKLSNHSQKMFKSRFKSRLGFAHHWCRPNAFSSSKDDDQL